MIASQYKRGTHREGRLIEELVTGKLRLEATGVAPLRFGFSVGDTCIGLFSALSFGERGIELARAWNSGKDTWDVFRQMWMPSKLLKRLYLIKPGQPLFIAELAADSDTVIDKVAFTCSSVEFDDTTLEGNDVLLFEIAALRGVTILG